ncbi:MAG: tetratricopeptide repeat protein [Lacunisphaera sp.]
MLRLILLLAVVAAPVLALDQPLHDQVNTLIKDRQWAQAQAVLEKATAANPKDAEAWALLGQAYMTLNNAESSVAALETATALDPQSSNDQRLLGDAYGLSAQKAGLFGKLGFARKCKAAYDQAVVLDPKNIDARWSVMEYCRQAPAIAGGGMDAAYAQAEAIRQIDPARGRVALATLYVADKRMIEAFGLFDEALKAEPDDYVTLYQLGRLTAMTGQRIDQGLACLRRCLTMTPPTSQLGFAPVNWRIGNLLEKKGDKAGARAAYEAAIAIDPGFVRALEDLRKLNEAK